ncbi:universal stress protein [Corynebacterium sp. CCUG 65737]|uniref:universal stress protein n=1 Tax=unclassified Corynebacterium TaxID=2624378 RepID=UPI00210E352A|nr:MULTISPECIES: universal stress protein [unclassified Corynebacterium]MCQ4618986.1 universal stress protein [Corynebacterium pseudogenitalium]MCQ4625800.1 universal stress protein [Corynebacterium sp. CCUG 69979]MCQ4627821.1 universal stress protein [Corynebacterium sp. CCUG 65737]
MSREDMVVVAVDGGEPSNNAVRWAANTANKRGVPLRLASSYTMPQFLYAEGMVPPQELYDDLQNECLRKIADARDIALEVAPDIKIGHTVAEGSPIDMLLDLSKESTMIVMGSRGLGGLSGMVLGSVSAAVVSHASCPVVVVRDDNAVTEDTKYGPVVVGVDGSEVSVKATQVAFEEAQARGAELVAVHTYMDNSSPAAGAIVTEDQLQQVDQQRAQKLEDALSSFSTEFPNVTVRKVVTRDRPVRALVEQAQGAQLLITGSHGRGGFKGMLLGSTSRALLQAAPCPMMVVRPEKLPK